MVICCHKERCPTWAGSPLRNCFHLQNKAGESVRAAAVSLAAVIAVNGLRSRGFEKERSMGARGASDGLIRCLRSLASTVTGAMHNARTNAKSHGLDIRPRLLREQK
jgi:hypothetical protein